MTMYEVEALAVAALCFLVTILLVPDLSSEVLEFVKSVWKGVKKK